jgi:hypothetical protein
VEISSITPWIAIISSLSALIIGLVTALWAYTKFIVERGLLPPTQFEIECNVLGTQHDVTLLEIILHLKNRGSSALIAMNIRLDIRYLEREQVPELGYPEGTETKDEAERKGLMFGRVLFPRSVRRELERKSRSPRTEPLKDAVPSATQQEARRWWSVGAKQRRKNRNKREPRGRERRGFSVMPHDSFVQPGIDQQYTFETAVPSSTSYILAWASFEYAQSPKLVQRAMLWLSRRLGLIQFTLRHVREPHTIERVFKL